MTSEKVDTMRRDVYQALIEDLRVEARRINVEIVNDSVVLKGEVPSFTSIKVAETIARKVSGGRVKNYLRSKNSPLFANP